jgi:hypothetical protein
MFRTFFQLWRVFITPTVESMSVNLGHVRLKISQSGLPRVRILAPTKPTLAGNIFRHTVQPDWGRCQALVSMPALNWSSPSR